MIILDTDVFSLLELPDSPEFRRLRSKIAQLNSSEAIVTTVITYEEQSRGRLASVSTARSARELVQSYSHLAQHIHNYQEIPLIRFDNAAASVAISLQNSKVRIGTMDLRIAAIALANDALLVSRNLRDFKKVQNLRVEDWTKS